MCAVMMPTPAHNCTGGQPTDALPHLQQSAAARAGGDVRGGGPVARHSAHTRRACFPLHARNCLPLIYKPPPAATQHARALCSSALGGGRGLFCVWFALSLCGSHFASCTGRGLFCVPYDSHSSVGPRVGRGPPPTPHLIGCSSRTQHIEQIILNVYTSL